MKWKTVETKKRAAKIIEGATLGQKFQAFFGSPIASISCQL
jgi:hypothetical protein